MEPLFTSALVKAAKKLHSHPYWVGGPVRDQILGVTCHDWDLVCRHARLLARAAAKALKGKFIVLDEQYKIYRIILPGATIDVAEQHGTSIAEDLGRRDFTINAMAQSVGGGALIDPFGGQRDLRRGVLRMVSPRAFDEDPLRLLRAFRFAAQFNLALDAKTGRQITQKHRLLTKVSAERVREELLRLLRQPSAAPVLRVMARSGLLATIVPELEACRRTAVRFYGRGGVLKHSLATVENLEWIVQHLRFADDEIQTKLSGYLAVIQGGYPREAWLKLAGLLHDIGKPATAEVIKGRLRFFGHEEVGADLARRRMQALRCSREETHWITLWVRHHMRLGNLAAAPRASDKAVARFFRSIGDDGGVGMLLVSLADHFTYLSPRVRGKGRDPVEKQMRQMLEAYWVRHAKILPPRIINGHELMQRLRLKPGPVIGRLLEAVQDAQTTGTVRTRDEAFVLAKRLVKTGKSNANRENVIRGDNSHKPSI